MTYEQVWAFSKIQFPKLRRKIDVYITEEIGVTPETEVQLYLDPGEFGWHACFVAKKITYIVFYSKVRGTGFKIEPLKGFDEHGRIIVTSY